MIVSASRLVGGIIRKTNSVCAALASFAPNRSAHGFAPASHHPQNQQGLRSFGFVRADLRLDAPTSWSRCPGLLARWRHPPHPRQGPAQDNRPEMIDASKRAAESASVHTINNPTKSAFVSW